MTHLVQGSIHGSVQISVHGTGRYLFDHPNSEPLSFPNEFFSDMR